jgi:hypothetical protein
LCLVSTLYPLKRFIGSPQPAGTTACGLAHHLAREPVHKPALEVFSKQGKSSPVSNSLIQLSRALPNPQPAGIVQVSARGF